MGQTVCDNYDFNNAISWPMFSLLVYAQGIASIKIIQCPNDIGSIYDSAMVSISLQQTASEAASGYVHFVSKSSDYVAFSPPSFDTGDMTPDQVETFNFTVTNLGETQDTLTLFEIQIYNHNPIQGDQMTDNRTVTMTLLNRNIPLTTLTVYTIDGDTSSHLGGIHVIVNYGNQSQNGDTLSGIVSFDFGRSSPSATVTAVDPNSTYSTVARTQQLTSGLNSITLKMYKTGEAPTEIPWPLIGVLLVVIVAFIVVVYGATRKRKK